MNKFFCSFFQKFLIFFSATTFFVGIIFTSLFFYFLNDIPDYKNLYKDSLSLSSRVYSSNGELITEFSQEHRIFIPIEMVPEKLIQAFLATEDKNFYHNSGIDIMGIFRAMIKNLFSFRESKLVGGSTITQQVVKNYILGGEKSLKRKIQEAILALRISNSFSKNQIMELYLNKIYFGNGAYGVASASLRYFDKNIYELSLADFALLAAMPQAPSKLDPFKNYYKAKERRDFVLIRMYEEGFIEESELHRAQLTPINLSREYKGVKLVNDYFVEELRRRLFKEYKENLYKEGFYIRATLNTKYQAAAVRALKNGLLAYDKKTGWRGPISSFDNTKNWIQNLQNINNPDGITDWEIGVILTIVDMSATVGTKNGKIGKISDISWATNIKVGDVVVIKDESVGKYNEKEFSIQQIPKVNGGIVVIEIETGKVLAMVGGYDFNKSQFNSVTQAMRQPGSLFKPFVYLAALENHFTPSTIINDEKISLFQGNNMELWEPKNYGNTFFGPTTLRTALEKSRNVVTVHIANILGIEKIMKIAKKFDIYSDDKYNLATVLGSEVVNLLTITKAYAMIGNGGKYIDVHLYEKIQDRNGKNIFLLDGNNCKQCHDFEQNPEIVENKIQIIEPVYASQMISLLEGSVKNGTAKKLKIFDVTLAGKTGTTSNSTDAWFIGFNPKIVVGIYIGYDQPETLGKTATGAGLALPIFADFFKNIVNDFDNIPFKTAKEISLVPINPITGNFDNNSSNAILESYKKGTEPEMFDDIAINDLIFDMTM